MSKQITLSTCLAFLALHSLQAQDFSKFKFGLHLSPSLSWINTDDNTVDGSSSALGIKLATQAEFFFAPNYAIETGIGFHFNTGGTLQSAGGGQFFTRAIPEGQAYNDPNDLTTGNVELDYSIQFVEIPLALKLRTREFGYITYYGTAPIFTFGFRGNSKGSISGGGQTAREDFDIKKEVTPVALSWGFGGGAEYSVSESTRVFAGLQFQRLFTDVTKDGPYVYETRRTAGTSGDPKATINSLTLKLGVLF